MWHWGLLFERSTFWFCMYLFWKVYSTFGCKCKGFLIFSSSYGKLIIWPCLTWAKTHVFPLCGFTSTGSVKCLWTTLCLGSPVCHQTAIRPSVCWATACTPQKSCPSREDAGIWAVYSSLTVGIPCLDWNHAQSSLWLSLLVFFNLRILCTSLLYAHHRSLSVVYCLPIWPQCCSLLVNVWPCFLADV